MRKQGSVSLFTAMIFLLVASVITTTITSARIHCAGVITSTSLAMALDSVFAEYNADLYDKFGVLLKDGADEEGRLDSDALSARLADYMDYNINTEKNLYFAPGTDLYGITLDGVAVSQLTTATDYGGLLWQDMVVDYEKYAKVINLAADYLGIESDDEQAEAVKEISDQIIDCTSQVLEINNQARELVKYIDGIECPEDGIDMEQISASMESVKNFCVGDVSSAYLGINNSDIFDKVKVHITDVDETIDVAIDMLEKGKNDKAQNRINELIELARDCEYCIDAAGTVINGIDNKITMLEGNIGSLETYMTSKSDILGTDIISGIDEELVELKDYREILAADICDIGTVKVSLQTDMDIVIRVREELEGIKGSSSAKTIEVLKDVRECSMGYTLDGMSFDYTRLIKAESDTGAMDSLSDFLENGILGLVVPEDTAISTKKLEEMDRASMSCNTSSAKELQKNIDLTVRGTKNIIYSEYVMDNFASFTDGSDSNSLDYEVEYILCGNPADNDNLMETVNKMALIRSGINMVYLMTDAGKKQQAYGLAALMVGASGIEPLIRLLQFALLYLWAYAEGLSDVKILLAGGKIGYGKSEKTWNLSLENLLAHKLYSNREQDEHGMDYETFLRYLLYIENPGEKSAYTMNLVEQWMIVNKDESFRMRNCIYGLKAEIKYTLNGLATQYTDTSVYTY